MSLDVSPDGTSIAFDVLGGIYVVRARGGLARRIAESRGWDQDPKFSRDGQQIAFISDRDGLATIWVAATDGTNARRLVADTTATYSALSWTRRDWILARRVPTSGADHPQQIVEVALRGRDVREIHVEPIAAGAIESGDGSLLYYGAIDGRLLALDPTNGQMKPSPVAGSGCGLIPSISRDDKLLAYGCAANGVIDLYVARLGEHTRKLLLAGVAPFFGWSTESVNTLPRGAFSADDRYFYEAVGGVIQRINVEDGRHDTIPVVVDIQRQVLRPQTSSLHVPTDSQLARSISWPSMTADGKQAAFVVAGKAYILDVATGVSRRVTSLPDSVIEIGPAISPDGSKVALATWDAGGAGKIVATTTTGTSLVVVDAKRGRAGPPAWSSHGDELGFARDARREGESEEPATQATIEVVRVAAPQTARLVDEVSLDNSARWRFPRIEFAHHDSALLVTSRGRVRSQVLEIDLAQASSQTIGDVSGAEDVAISPSGKMIATTQRATLRVGAFRGRATGVTSAKSTATVAQFRPGGAFVRWSGDSVVTWASGNAIYRGSVAFGGAATRIAPKVVLRRSVARRTIALVGGRVITMRGDEMIPDATIVVADGRIASVGQRGAISIPHDAYVIDLHGRTIVPGLVDTHAHIYSEPPDAPSAVGERYRAYLSYGVTTTFDPQASSLSAFSYGEETATGRYVGPRALTSGDPLYGGHGYDLAFPAETVLGDDDADVESAIGELAFAGAAMIKVYEQPRRDRRQKLASSAASHGLRVTAEGACDLALDLTVAADGYDALEHAPPVELFDDVVQWFARTGVSYTPTLGMACGTGGATAFFIKRRAERSLVGVLPQQTRASLLQYRRVFAAAGDDTSFVIMARGAVHVLRAGGSVSLGSHGTIPGLGMAWEVEALAMGGATAMEALRAATLGGARKLGLANDIGSIIPGKIADLAILRGDPMANLAAIERVEFVMHDGILRRANNLSRVSPSAR